MILRSFHQGVRRILTCQPRSRGFFTHPPAFRPEAAELPSIEGYDTCSHYLRAVFEMKPPSVLDWDYILEEITETLPPGSFQQIEEEEDEMPDYDALAFRLPVEMQPAKTFSHLAQR